MIYFVNIKLLKASKYQRSLFNSYLSGEDQRTVFSKNCGCCRGGAQSSDVDECKLRRRRRMVSTGMLTLQRSSRYMKEVDCLQKWVNQIVPSA